jgi:chaperone required for assembly of F1-ATPase
LARRPLVEPPPTMKRFFENAAVVAQDDGFAILLDGRALRSPARKALLLPSRALADAIAAEWNVQGEKVEPRSMPLAGLANAAIDRIAPEREAFASGLAAYGGSDLLCYRAEGPASLVTRQAEHWDPLLAWARHRYDVDFESVCGIMPRPQPDETLRRLTAAVNARGAFELAGLSPLVTISGSLLIGLALAEGAIDLEQGWAAASLDEQWQAEQWGEDAEAARALAARRADFEAGYRFLRLLQPGA